LVVPICFGFVGGVGRKEGRKEERKKERKEITKQLVGCPSEKYLIL
jgi:hypothetical protein